MATVRERLWLWGHYEGSQNEGWGLPRPSRITPVEAAFYLGVPNVIMVSYRGLSDRGQPQPPFDQYAVPFRALNQVVWSIVGEGGHTQEAERAQVFDLASRLPNMTGVLMDDFFRSPQAGSEDVGVMSVAQLHEVRNRLQRGGRSLALWVVLYAHQIGLPVEAHLRLCDRVTFWTWRAQDLANLEQNFAAAEKLAPDIGKVLGCYMWDYGNRRPMPLALMEKQCHLGLRWLQEGRIEGMIFLASCICDLDLETVEWTRRWIAQVSDQAI